MKKKRTFVSPAPAYLRRSAFALPVAAAALMACGAPESQSAQNPLAEEPGFAAIPREDVPATQVNAMKQALTTAAAPIGILQAGVGSNFYLAINKKELEQRYFLSLFAKQYFPTAVSGGASRSMGTRVVQFKLTNGRLYVYEVSDIKRTSVSFAPDAVLIDAYPVVSYAPFERLPGASNYILIDPGAGLNRIGIAQGAAYGSAPFQIELSMLQNFRRLADGVAYEHIVTGYSDLVLGDDPKNLFRGVGTIGVAFRRYQETANFKIVTPLDPPRKLPVTDAKMGDPNAPLKQEAGWGSYFFVTAPRLRSADSKLGPRYPYDDLEFPKVDQPAIRWGLDDPNRTINWVISPLVPKKYQKTVLDAIESWNKVFGRKVVVARVADPGETYDDDDKSFLIYDGDPTFGAAFANWRNNPLTGEILGASVYINAIWFEAADDIEKNPLPNLLTRGNPEGQAARKPTPRLQWLGVTEAPLCELWAKDALHSLNEAPGIDQLTGTEQAQRYVFNTVAHEIGHTLGLRHNFKGSLGVSMTNPGGNSVMEYQTARQGIAGPGPGPYDQVALDLLYKLDFGTFTVNGTTRTGYKTPIALAIPFCTDNGVATDPTCQTFDEGVVPLTDWHIPRFNPVVADFLAGRSNTLPNSTLNGVMMFLRAGAAADQLTAWNKLIESIKVGVVAPMNPPADYAARVSALTLQVWRRMFLDPTSALGNITAAVPTTTAWLNRYYPEIQGILVNTDGLRSYSARRPMVDILKKLQLAAAQNILINARATLAAQVVPPASADLHADLIARVDAALASYWAQ